MLLSTMQMKHESDFSWDYFSTNCFSIDVSSPVVLLLMLLLLLRRMQMLGCWDGRQLVVVLQFLF